MTHRKRVYHLLSIHSIINQTVHHRESSVDIEIWPGVTSEFTIQNNPFHNYTIQCLNSLIAGYAYIFGNMYQGSAGIWV